MNWEETNPKVIDNMKEWQKRLKEHVFDKETEHVPHAVAILAAVDFTIDRIDQSDVVRPEHIIQILEDRFFEKEIEGTDLCTQEPAGNN